MNHELLVSEDKRSYFINNKRHNGILEVGAVYIAPFSSSPMTIVDENGAKFTLTLPSDVTDQNIEMVAIGTSFFID
tara:strand:+ start:399 stop:626 length:228 start_codon:yes stop_codon:yes gene_type:complete